MTICWTDPFMVQNQIVVILVRIADVADFQLFEVAEAGDGVGSSLARLKAGRSSAARMAMMAITTKSSISVNPPERFGDL